MTFQLWPFWDDRPNSTF